MSIINAEVQMVQESADLLVEGCLPTDAISIEVCKNNFDALLVEMNDVASYSTVAYRAVSNKAAAKHLLVLRSDVIDSIVSFELNGTVIPRKLIRAIGVVSDVELSSIISTVAKNLRRTHHKQCDFQALVSNVNSLRS